MKAGIVRLYWMKVAFIANVGVEGAEEGRGDAAAADEGALDRGGVAVVAGDEDAVVAPARA